MIFLLIVIVLLCSDMHPKQTSNTAPPSHCSSTIVSFWCMFVLTVSPLQPLHHCVPGRVMAAPRSDLTVWKPGWDKLQRCIYKSKQGDIFVNSVWSEAASSERGWRVFWCAALPAARHWQERWVLVPDSSFFPFVFKLRRIALMKEPAIRVSVQPLQALKAWTMFPVM